MMPLEPVVLSAGAALLLGLGYGAGPCSIACLPILGPVFTATEGGVRDAWRTLLPFSLGRLTGYALLGGLAGGLGLLVEDWLAAPWVRWLLAAATLLVALSLLFRRKSAACDSSCNAHHPTLLMPTTSNSQRGNTTSNKLLPGSLFLLGMGLALNPCAPLTTLVLASATSASIVTGVTLGSGFALGAILVPSLIFAFGLAHFGQQIRHHLAEHRAGLEYTSVGLLILTGTATAMGWITP
jgi:uncharacterized protein